MIAGDAKCFALHSITASACNFETLGKSSRNESIVMPFSRCQNKLSTGTRVPRNTGLPNWTLLFTDI